MEISFKLSTLALTILFTGLSAGLCFTWANAITPGIRRLNDLGFLQSFQEMNKAIINPMFLVVFFGPFFINILNIYLYRDPSSLIFWMLFFAGSSYILGVVLVTILGNVPLNEVLDKTNLPAASMEELKILRTNFEDRWNKFHLIRTVTSIISFVLLLLSAIQIIITNY